MGFCSQKEEKKMNKVKRNFNLYWKQVMPCLTCPRQTAKHFRSEAYQSYLNYLEECPKENAHPQELFGEPTDFAAFIMERLDEAEIQKTYTKRIGVKVALVVLAIAAIAIACLAIYLSRNPLVITHKEETITIQYPDGTNEDDLPPLEDVAKMIQETKGNS
jgi:hypothetical protein